jgi:nucleoid-associated protein YgaU
MLFLLGYGPLDISQIKIGDTAIEDYEDAEWELRSGFPDDAPARLYPGAVAEAELNIQLRKTNGAAALAVPDTVYECGVVERVKRIRATGAGCANSSRVRRRRRRESASPRPSADR